jgi:carboxymethylenebutenolidase
MGGTLTLFSAARLPEVKAGVVYYGFPINVHPTPNRPDNPIDEVAQLQVPLLGFFGEADAGVGVENVKAYEAAAQKAGKQIDFTIYPVVGHGFLTFDEEGAAVRASQESWSRAIDFFKEYLGANA